MKDSIYLDHSATTPLRSEVLEAMMPYLTDRFGNAGSVHRFGRVCREAIDTAREQVAALINADPREIIFTSGATESDNLAIGGLVEAERRESKNIIVSSVEHHAVLHAAERLDRLGVARVRLVEVDSEGRIDPSRLREAIDEETAIVSIMHANNETGVVQPIEEIGRICREASVPFHSDTAQSVGKLPIDVGRSPVDLLSISGHKFYGPKGVGALYRRQGIRLAAQSVGGGQERGRRAGTENVAGIVGLGRACELAGAEMKEESSRLSNLRDRFESELRRRVREVRVNGGDADRLPNISNIGFEYLEGEAGPFALDQRGIAVSTGSACTAGSLDPSHVLLAMGQDHRRAQSAVRFSLGRRTTAEAIDEVLRIIPDVVERLRSESPLAVSGVGD